MTETIDTLDHIYLPGWGIVTGEVILDMGCDGDRWSPPEAPAVESGTLTTEGGIDLDVEELVEDDDTHTLLMNQIAALPRFQSW